MSVFKLQEEEYLGIYNDLSEHDSYDAAMLAGIEMFDSNRLDDFFILDVENNLRYHIYGHTLIEETCPICGKTVRRYKMERTKDCNGIAFRLVCSDCYDRIMEEKGYDGEYYDEFDERIEPDYLFFAP